MAIVKYYKEICADPESSDIEWEFQEKYGWADWDTDNERYINAYGALNVTVRLEYELNTDTGDMKLIKTTVI